MYCTCSSPVFLCVCSRWENALGLCLVLAKYCTRACFFFCVRLCKCMAAARTEMDLGFTVPPKCRSFHINTQSVSKSVCFVRWWIWCHVSLGLSAWMLLPSPFIFRRVKWGPFRNMMSFQPIYVSSLRKLRLVLKLRTTVSDKCSVVVWLIVLKD